MQLTPERRRPDDTLAAAEPGRSGLEAGPTISLGTDVDGRRHRRQRNRDAVVDALLDLFRDGDLRPGACQIAARAGLSPRSLFRYFDDVDDLIRAAVSRQLERAMPLLPIETPVDAPLSERIDAVVRQRFRLFAEVAPAARVVRLRAPFQPMLAAELARSRSYLRHQLRQVFDAELSAMGAVQASATLAMIDVVCSFESYELLCGDRDVPVDEAGSVVAAAIDALLVRSHPLTHLARATDSNRGDRGDREDHR